MKLPNHDNTLLTNTEFESQEFGIGNASVVIEILRNRLYKNPIRVLTQEYISNGRDANREVNSKTPMEITIPNKLNPVFKVRDFGPGLDPKRIREVFVMYGNSTKRDTNDQTGGFGIGAKSAWSYTDSFTVISYVDGVKRSYVAHTGVSNNGRLDHINTEETSEPNGTEIHVAVNPNDLNDFRESILRTTYFWEQDETPIFKGIIDAQDMRRVEGLKLDDQLEIVDSDLLPNYIDMDKWNTHNTPLAIIDGIPYKLGSEFLNKCRPLELLNNIVKKRLMIFVGNGVLEVSADREGIADRDLTIKNLDKITGRLFNKVQAYIKKKFESVKSTNEYLNTYVKMNESFEVGKHAKHKSYFIRYGSIASELLKKVSITRCSTKAHVITDKTKVKRDEHTNTHLPLDYFDSVCYMDVEETKVKENKRIREHFRSNTKLYIIAPRKNEKRAFNIIKKDFGLKKFSSLEYVEPEKIKRVKVERDKTEFCMHTFRNWQSSEHTTLIDNDQKWLYVPMEKGAWPTGERYPYKNLDRYLYENTNYRVCGLSRKSLSTIQGDPNFKPLQVWMDKFTINQGHVDFYINASKRNTDNVKVLFKLEKDLKDPFLKSMIKKYVELNGAKKIKLPNMLKDRVEEHKSYKDFQVKDAALEKLLDDKYKLVRVVEGWDEMYPELVFYINAKYKGEK